MAEKWGNGYILQFPTQIIQLYQKTVISNMYGIRTVFVVALLAVLQVQAIEYESRANTHTIHGRWDLFVEKCWSGGEDYQTKTYNLGNLNKQFNLTYEQLIEQSIIIKASGFFEVDVKSSVEQKGAMYLAVTSDVDKKVTYVGDITLNSEVGWATQNAKIELTLTVDREGNAVLTNYVYAGSWGSVSCCHAKSDANSIMIII